MKLNIDRKNRLIDEMLVLQELGTEFGPQNPQLKNHAWWHIFIIPTLGSLRRADLWRSL